MSEITLYKGDCLIEMNKIADKSVDLILTDLPYGITACSWDIVIPFDKMWNQIDRVAKDNCAILLFGTEPFSSKLRCSNLEMYKYDLYWVKEKPTNFLQLKKRFGKTTENICIFYKNQPTYNPQKYKHDGKIVTNRAKQKNNNSITTAIGFKNINEYYDDGTRYPTDILKFNREKLGSTVHPTQKPIQLLEFLIKSFSDENDVVLDFTMGSGSTGIACVNTNRNFIGIEKDDNYFKIVEDRMNKVK